VASQRCRTCSKNVAPGATTCSHCGSPQGRKKAVPGPHGAPPIEVLDDAPLPIVPGPHGAPPQAKDQLDAPSCGVQQKRRFGGGTF